MMNKTESITTTYDPRATLLRIVLEKYNNPDNEAVQALCAWFKPMAERDIKKNCYDTPFP